MAENTKKTKVLPLILGAVLLIAGIFIVRTLTYMFSNEETENAYLESNISTISPKTSGYVLEVRINDNQRIQKGDTLVLLDDRELRLRVQQAEIALKNAEVNLDITQANAGTAGTNVGLAKSNFETSVGSVDAVGAGIATAQANIDAAKARAWKANEDFKRYTVLLAQKAVTQQQFDAIKTEKDAADAILKGAERQLEAVSKQVDVAKKQSKAGLSQESVAKKQLGTAQQQIELAKVIIEQRKSELDFARLQLSYAALIAPCDGVVSKKAVQIGQLLNIGSPICSILDDQNVWITANFKETQVAKMHAGDKVKVKVDAYPKIDFEGEIESIAGATGAKFALLPPDNASGNFVKVVQRIPVKIILKQQPNTILRTGMSTKVIVPIK